MVVTRVSAAPAFGWKVIVTATRTASEGRSFSAARLRRSGTRTAPAAATALRAEPSAGLGARRGGPDARAGRRGDGEGAGLGHVDEQRGAVLRPVADDVGQLRDVALDRHRDDALEVGIVLDAVARRAIAARLGGVPEAVAAPALAVLLARVDEPERALRVARVPAVVLAAARIEAHLELGVDRRRERRREAEEPVAIGGPAGGAYSSWRWRWTS